MRNQIANGLFTLLGIAVGVGCTYLILSDVYQKEHTALTEKVKQDTIFEYCT